jgi:hypothetical protein
MFLSCASTYINAFFYPQWLPFQHALQLHSFLPFPLIHFNFHTIYEHITYQFLLFMSIHHPTFHISHSMSSQVARSIVEPKFIMLFFSHNFIFVPTKKWSYHHGATQNVWIICTLEINNNTLFLKLQICQFLLWIFFGYVFKFETDTLALVHIYIKI